MKIIASILSELIDIFQLKKEFKISILYVNKAIFQDEIYTAVSSA